MADKTKYNEYVAALKAELIIPIEQVMATSALDLNIDEVKLIFACVNAQKLYLEPQIGSALMRKLQEPNPTFEYKLLLDKFVNDAIINWGCAEAIRSVAYQVANGGVYKHIPSDGEPVTAAEVNTIRQQYLYKADTFAKRLSEFLCKNTSYYPEYSEGAADGITANKENKFTGGLFIEGPSCSNSHVGASNPEIFVSETWWGNNNETMMGFDPNTLANTDNNLPSPIFAQPVMNYFWIVSSSDFVIGQLGIFIPLDSFLNTIPDEAVYVKGTYEDLTWIRIKIADVYEQQVQFETFLVK
jgi:hypothetical protein